MRLLPGWWTQVAEISVKTTTVVRQRRRIDNQPVLVWALASAGLMLIGAFGPWAKVLGIISLSWFVRD